MYKPAKCETKIALRDDRISKQDSLRYPMADGQFWPVGISTVI